MSVIHEITDYPTHWGEVTLGGVAEVISGHGFPKEYQGHTSGELPFFKVGDISREVQNGKKFVSQADNYVSRSTAEEIGASPVPEGAVVFAKIGEAVKLNRRGILGQESLIDNNVMALVASEEAIERDYLYYFMQGFDMGRLTRATTVPSIRKSDVLEIKIPLPPLPEQRRIVAKIEELFSNLDAGMGDLQAAEQQLERYRLSVLQAAVEGRLTAEWRRTHDPEPADQLLERILEKRRDRWEEDYRTKRYDSKGKTPPDGWKDRYSEPDSVNSSDLPSLPSSWKWVRFEQISLLDSGYAFSSEKFADEGMPLLRGANVAPGHLKWGDTEYWPEDEVGPYEHLIVEEGDIILAMDRPLINAGLKIARAEDSDTPCLLVQRVARFKPVFESLTAFLYLTCSTQRFIAHLREGQTGTQIPHVSKKSLRAYPVPLPPLVEQKQIVNEVERLLSVADDAAATADREHTRAERLRQSILKQAFSGRLVPHEDGASPPSLSGTTSEDSDTGSRNDVNSDVEDLMGSADPSKQIEMDL